MAPANKKIRLQYLWADEAVMRDDFAKSISKGMTDFANQFYKRFGFELDVSPGPDVKTVAKASKLALAKNDGVRPDMASVPAVVEKNNARAAAIDKQIEALMKERDEAQAKLALLAPNDSATQVPLLQAMTAKSEAISKLSREAIALAKESQAAQALAKGDTQLRIQMAINFMLGNFPDEKRLNVVWCRFVPQPKTPLKGDSLAETRTQIPVQLWGPFVLWPFTYIVVDIAARELLSLAHEIVHAAGHNHPPAQVLFRDLKKTQKLFQAPTSVGDAFAKFATIVNPLEFFSQFVEVPGGYFDGPDTDVMNYMSQGKPASQLTLSDADKKLLEVASFVVG